MKKVCYVRLPVKNAYNIRDLGGYACESGGVTRWHTFLRGDDLAFLDRSDIDFLLNYGVRTVVDLRSEDEIKRNPDPFSSMGKVEYFNIPLMAGKIADITKTSADQLSGFVADFYIGIIKEEPGLVKKVLETIAAAGEGAVLFHCTVGKDRTGVIAAILLGIAGVGTEDIISNYEVTYTYNSVNPLFEDANKRFPVELMLSKAEYLESTLKYIKESYGSLGEYLEHAGVSQKILNDIRERFVQS